MFKLSIHPWVKGLYSYYIYPLIPFLILFLKTGASWIQNHIYNSKIKFLYTFSKIKTTTCFDNYNFLFRFLETLRKQNIQLCSNPNQIKLKN
ncbi:membrane protein, PF09852 domain protein [Leptospira interrogans serovar Pyrogenes str. 200701872]|uniref:Membrane protein, PF09852 domain protein n=1 Tax=Leptospira interrogans serovar Pyrogenes str. 200701872 TaxID=1193029 RepID=M6ZVF2_LEPIR|nr:membrane protein, PF09852 domain protein [Leptospira interrogans serovar Pyrogenes str. 200701872]